MVVDGKFVITFSIPVEVLVDIINRHRETLGEAPVTTEHVLKAAEALNAEIQRDVALVYVEELKNVRPHDEGVEFLSEIL